MLKQVAYLNQILAERSLRMQIIKDELDELKERYGDERRTSITHSADDIDIEDMIPNEAMVITISHQGYVEAQPRG